MSAGPLNRPSLKLLSSCLLILPILFAPITQVGALGDKGQVAGEEAGPLAAQRSEPPGLRVSGRQNLFANGVSQYDSGATFDADWPNLITETFEEGSAAAGSLTACTNPIDSGTNNTCFTPGQIEPGVVFDAVPGLSTNNFALVGIGYPGKGNTSKFLLTNYSSDELELRFIDEYVNVVGMNLHRWVNDGPVDIEIFGRDDTLLATTYAGASIDGATFWGLTTAGPIRRIMISAVGDFVGVDNVAFGSRDLVQYTSRAAFDADWSNLPVEDFEEGVVSPAQIGTFSGPLDGSTDNTYFSPNDILPGLILDAEPSASNDLALVGAGYPNKGNSSKFILTNYSLDRMDIRFPLENVNVVGMDLFLWTVSGQVDIEIFGERNRLLGRTISSANTSGSTFWGVVAADTISRITLKTRGTVNWEGLDNVSFGASVTEDLGVDFGPAYGLWTAQNGGIWNQVHLLSSEALLTADLDGNGLDDLVVNFGSGLGVYAWMNHATWQSIHPAVPSQMVTGDFDKTGQDDVVFDLPSFGLWRFDNNSAWAPLHGLSAARLAVGNLDGTGGDELLVGFAGVGLWVYGEATGWTQLHGFDVSQLLTADLDGNGQDDIVVAFPGLGLWSLVNQTTWTQLHPLSPTHIAAGYLDNNSMADLVIDFGLGLGISTLRNDTTWTPLHSFTSEGLLPVDIDGDGIDEVVIDFGPGVGLWAYVNDGSWVMVHGLSPKGMVAGRFH